MHPVFVASCLKATVGLSTGGDGQMTLSLAHWPARPARIPPTRRSAARAGQSSVPATPQPSSVAATSTGRRTPATRVASAAAECARIRAASSASSRAARSASAMPLRRHDGRQQRQRHAARQAAATRSQTSRPRRAAGSEPKPAATASAARAGRQPKPSARRLRRADPLPRQRLAAAHGRRAAPTVPPSSFDSRWSAAPLSRFGSVVSNRQRQAPVCSTGIFVMM